jgi:4'-phosphopantetheinyl transferase
MEPDWSPPPPSLALSPGTVHVWRVPLDRPEDECRRLWDTLSADEQERAARFHFAKHRDRFTVGRGLLRAVLGRYLGVRAGEVRFAYGKYGKPAVVAAAGDALECNVSHCEGAALFAVTRDRSVGIDLEQVRPREGLADLVAKVFSASEQAVFRGLPAGQQLEAFYRCWTRKEAFMKATGQGMSLAPERIDVTLAPGAPARLLGVRGEPVDIARWSLVDLTPWPGCAGALAIEGPVSDLRCWDGVYLLPEL